jgi:guanosine-3',5'-bis(diphosphate) 3'-pyrophosphohydrolase
MNTDSYAILPLIFEALKFAAYKHRRQKRKGLIGIPYINHPIEVANLILKVVEKPGPDLIIAAILHDVIEDTRTRFSDIEERFGREVSGIVKEVTDNMNLPSLLRKREQINKAASLSFEAKCIKIADKTCNVHDLLFSRIRWSRLRKIEYIKWACEVVYRMKDAHPGLIAEFEQILEKARGNLRYNFERV